MKLRDTAACATIAMMATATAQIPNASFESWVNHGGYSDPAGWLTSNDLMTPQGHFITVEPGSPGAEGNTYALVQSRTTPQGMTIQGWMSAGSNGQGGFPCSNRPTALAGMWQYGIQQGDTGVVEAALSRYNALTGQTDVIAQGTLEITGSWASWAEFSVPLVYFSGETPDSAYIQFTSSINFSDPVAGSFIKVDALSFSGLTAITEAPATPGLLLFPSPAREALSIRAGSPLAEATVLDAAGRPVLHNRFNVGEAVMDVAPLPTGPYWVRVLLADGKQRVAGFNKE